MAWGFVCPVSSSGPDPQVSGAGASGVRRIQTTLDHNLDVLRDPGRDRAWCRRSQGCSSPTCPGGNFPAAGAGDCRPIGPGHAGHRNRSHGHLRSLGRIAWKTLLYFEIVTTFALVLGAIAIHISRAGEGITLPATISANDSVATIVTHPGVESFLLNMFPENVALAVSQNQILQVAIFAILFGISLALLPEQKRAQCWRCSPR